MAAVQDGGAHVLLPVLREMQGTITATYWGYSSTDTHRFMPGETDKIFICKTKE